MDSVNPTRTPSNSNCLPYLREVTMDMFLKAYNLVVTRCFGWGLPSTMIVPFADFLNHTSINSLFEVYSESFHFKGKNG
jgi:hypothetical protein